MGEFTYKEKVYHYDDRIHIDQLDGETLILEEPYHYDVYKIPAGFEWDGASSPNGPLARFIAPKFYKNIKASCVHDYLCSIARNKHDRKKADKAYFLMKKYVEKDHGIISKLSWLGVRIGAFFGIGNRFKENNQCVE